MRNGCDKVARMANKKTERKRSSWNDAGGILLFVLCAFFVLGMLSYNPGDISLLQSPPNQPPDNLIGPLGAWVCFGAVMLFGICAYIFPLMLGSMGCLLLFQRERRVWPKALWLFVLLISMICLTEVQVDLWGGLFHSLNVANPGGILGMLLGQKVLIALLGNAGTGILAVAGMMISLVFLFEIQSLSFMFQLSDWIRVLPQQMLALVSRRREGRDKLELEAEKLEKERRKLKKAMKARERGQRRKQRKEDRRESEELSSPSDALLPTPVAEPPEPKLEKPKRKTCPVVVSENEAEAVMPVIPDPMEVFVSDEDPALGQSHFKLPSLRLLNKLPPASERAVASDTETGARVLEETLSEFNIDAEVTNVDVGPVITSYEILPAPGIRVEKIVGLSNNIALSMKAESVRVQAPIPGKGVVGIEVPNQKAAAVYLREILESDSWKNSKAALPLALGKDVSGQEIVADMAKMPHLLIAGATGAGKSVCMNSILAGLLMTRTPDQMRLMLVDPKMVEFSFFNGLPHLVVPVITDPKKVAMGLRWAIREMENRYKLFARVGVRNIQAYNQRPIMTQEELFDEDTLPPASPSGKKKDPDRLPYLVIVIDELADLMMVAQADVENAIARLAQLSRAVGIHMIIATQRPSVNVITGTIKANLPSRIAFKVAQRNDSRVILDGNGADKLLGKGDMLFLPPGASSLIRSQGTLTTDDEIRAVVNFWKNQGEPQYEEAIRDKIENTDSDFSGGGDGADDKDVELMDKAVEIIRQTQRASTSSLQRRLRIGYTRAARLMDMLEERGVVGPPNGSDPREILIDLDGEIPSNDS